MRGSVEKKRAEIHDFGTILSETVFGTGTRAAIQLRNNIRQLLRDLKVRQGGGERTTSTLNHPKCP